MISSTNARVWGSYAGNGGIHDHKARNLQDMRMPTQVNEFGAKAN